MFLCSLFRFRACRHLSGKLFFKYKHFHNFIGAQFPHSLQPLWSISSRNIGQQHFYSRYRLLRWAPDSPGHASVCQSTLVVLRSDVDSTHLFFAYCFLFYAFHRWRPVAIACFQALSAFVWDRVTGENLHFSSIDDEFFDGVNHTVWILVLNSVDLLVFILYEIYLRSVWICLVSYVMKILLFIRYANREYLLSYSHIHTTPWQLPIRWYTIIEKGGNHNKLPSITNVFCLSSIAISQQIHNSSKFVRWRCRWKWNERPISQQTPPAKPKWINFYFTRARQRINVICLRFAHDRM